MFSTRRPAVPGSERVGAPAVTLGFSLTVGVDPASTALHRPCGHGHIVGTHVHMLARP